MLTQQSLILTLATVFFAVKNRLLRCFSSLRVAQHVFLSLWAFVPGSHGQVLEESAILPFALAASKMLVIPPKPFIEVSSTKQVYISEGHVLTLADTQCLHTETPQIQLCFGNRWPTRVRLLPHGHLKIGLHSLGLSQLAYMHNPSFISEPLFPDSDAIPGQNPVARAITTQILQGVEEQGDIIEQARQRSLMLSYLSNHNSNHNSDTPLFEEPLAESDAEEEGEPIEWWGVAQQPAPDTSDGHMAQVRFDHNILLKPDTRYCFAPDARAKTYHQATPGDDSGSEDNSTSNESSDSDNDSDEEETETDSNVQFIDTTRVLFPASREIREDCKGLEQIKMAQEPTSGSKTPLGSEVEMAETDSLKPPVAPPSPATNKKRPHSGEKPYSCQECGRAFAYNCQLHKHQRTHSGKKPHRCQVCDKRFTQKGHLKVHLRIHSGERPYPCQVCDKRFTQKGQLKVHLRTHSGEKNHCCKVCGRAFAYDSTFKTHLRTHRTMKQPPTQRK